MIDTSSNSTTMLGFHVDGRCHAGLLSSFHHSESSMAFNLSDSSMDSWSLYDEATTEKVASSKKEPAPLESSFSILSIEPDDEALVESMPVATTHIVLDFSSSWPCARNHSKDSLTNTTKKNGTKNGTKSRKRRSPTVKLPAPQEQQQQQQQLVVAPPKRKPIKVRFAPTLMVRTHSLVLGDHPLCEDGLALDLGWDYEDSRDICQAYSTTKKNNYYLLPKWKQPIVLPYQQSARWMVPQPSQPSKPQSQQQYPRQRSYLERKRLLLEVGGCSEQQIEIRLFQARLFLEADRQREEQERQARRRKFQQNQLHLRNKNSNNISSSSSSIGNNIERRVPPPAVPQTNSYQSPRLRHHRVRNPQNNPRSRAGSVNKSLSRYSGMA